MTKFVFMIALAIPMFTMAAGKEINQEKATGAAPRVSLENVRGKIIVKGWDKKSVSISGTLDEQMDRFVFDSSEEQVKIVIDSDSNPRRWGGSEGIEHGSRLTIHIPAGATFDAEGFATDFTVEDVTGEIKLETVSGELRVSGNRSQINLETVSGDVVINDHEGIVFAESVSGDIDFSGLATRLELESVQGDINVNNQGQLDEGEFNSVSGDIDTKTHTGRRSNLEYNAVNGDIDISFLNAINAKIKIDTMSGDIRNGLTEDTANKQRWAGSSLVYTVGDGDGDIRISTVSGNVTIE